jgi:hypothetical protein
MFIPNAISDRRKWAPSAAIRKSQATARERAPPEAKALDRGDGYLVERFPGRAHVRADAQPLAPLDERRGGPLGQPAIAKVGAGREHRRAAKDDRAGRCVVAQTPGHGPERFHHLDSDDGDAPLDGYRDRTVAERL